MCTHCIDKQTKCLGEPCIGYVCYDDGCHLKKYASNPKRVNLTSTSSKIASLKIVIDKLHFRGHVDTWCREHCNPYKFSELDKVYVCMYASLALYKSIISFRLTQKYVSNFFLGCPDMLGLHSI